MNNRFSSLPRHELKFSFPQAMAPLVENRLIPLMEFDPHYPQKSYFVRSLYFDTPAHLSFYEKLAGLEERRKIRIRYYNYDPSFIVLEEKTKKGDLTLKRSGSLSVDSAQKMIFGDFSPLSDEKDPFLLEMYGELKSEAYAPSVIVDYQRTAFLIHNTDVRVTLDQNIRAIGTGSLFFSSNLPSRSAFEDRCVLEVKYNQFLPSYIETVFADIPLVREAVSKYTLCRTIVE